MQHTLFPYATAFPGHYQASQFPSSDLGGIIATWTDGVPTILPPCTHVAFVTHVRWQEFAIIIVPRVHAERLAERWWHDLEDGFVRIEPCTEEEWRVLVHETSHFAVDPHAGAGR